MKSLFLFTVLLLSGHSALFGQNLVPNPSFEEYLECPFADAEFENVVIDWYSWQASPDYFNVCNNEINGLVGVPENGLGYQYPVTGNAYSSLYTYAYYAPEIREYMAAPLNMSLVNGTEYYVMFYTSMYDGGLESESLCATNHIGLRFFKDPEYDNEVNIFEPDNFAHLDYSQVLIDTMGWTIVDGYFLADDNYNWLALGNFFDGSNTDTIILNNQERCFGIYYFDNVCVATDPAFCHELLYTQERSATYEISVYPNPTNRKIRVTSEEKRIDRLEMLDISGRTLIVWMDANVNYLEIDLTGFISGIYFLRIFRSDEILTEKIIKR